MKKFSTSNDTRPVASGTYSSAAGIRRREETGEPLPGVVNPAAFEVLKLDLSRAFASLASGRAK